MENNVTTKLKNLNLVDKFLFDETMEDREAYQAVISILLENETALLTKPQTEKELRVSPQLRQIRLDVVSMDDCIIRKCRRKYGKPDKKKPLLSEHAGSADAGQGTSPIRS